MDKLLNMHLTQITLGLRESLLEDINTTCEELNLNKEKLKNILYTTYSEDDFLGCCKKNNLNTQNFFFFLVADDIMWGVGSKLRVVK